MHKSLFALVLAVSACGGSLSSSTALDPQAGDESAAPEIFIALERTGCFGSCPIYTVSVDTAGLVTFVGGEFVASAGEALGQVEPATVVLLAEELVAAGILELTQAEVEDAPESWTDHPSAILTFRMGERSNRVEHYHGDKGTELLTRLTALEERIDELLGSSRWVAGG